MNPPERPKKVKAKSLVTGELMDGWVFTDHLIIFDNHGNIIEVQPWEETKAPEGRTPERPD
jgi:hypothetical protein